jgi:hypothetical protein
MGNSSDSDTVPEEAAVRYVDVGPDNVDKTGHYRSILYRKRL